MTAVASLPPRTPLRREMLALGLALGLNAVVFGLCLLLLRGGIAVANWVSPKPEPPWHPRLAAGPAGPAIATPVAEQGRDVFMNVCGVCHGLRGRGMPGLGKDLIHSDFVADSSDAELLKFIERGRPANDPLNSTKIAMPPKGGNPALTDDDLKSVVSYMRGLQDPRRMPQLEPWAPKPIVVSAAEKADALAAAGGDAELADYIASGNKIFHTTCIACHGQGGVGIEGNGKALANNAFIQSLDDGALFDFITRGRTPTDPLNTTGIQMPPKGGNPAMSEDDILDVIAYLRTLQPRSAAGG